MSVVPMVTAPRPGVPLLERDEALAALGALLDEARAGDGCTAVIAGPAGIGKTRLLQALADQAAARRMRVLTARGGELERDYSFGVVRELLEPAVRAADDAEQQELLSGAASLAAELVTPAAGTSREGLYPRLHGLYWLAVNLSARAPLVIVVDDAHWCDPESMRWLAYLARRVAGLPILLAGAWRTGEGEPPADLLGAGGVARIELGPLGSGSVARILGDEAPPELVEAAHRATGGNPFLVSELARALRSGEIDAGAVSGRAPAGVERDVQERLGRLPPAARELARAVATLGQEATLHQAARLAGIEDRAAAEASVLLERAGMLATSAPPRFAHPLVRHAVGASMPAAERSMAHARAARLLAEEGVADARVASQLLAAEPGADPWAAALLARAGDAAVAAGALDTGRRLLRRALAEPPPADRCADVLRALGTVEVALRDAAARGHLEEALRRTPEPRTRAEIGRELAHDHYLASEVPAAVDRLEAAIAELGPDERDLAMALEAQVAGFSLADRATVAAGRRRLAGLVGRVSDASGGERMVLAQLAFTETMAGGSREQAVEWARMALEGGLLGDVTPDAQLFQLAVSVFDAADLLDDAARWRTEGIDRARRAGSETGYAFCSCFRARTALATGALRDAEADARAAFSLADPSSRRVLGTAVAFLAEALVEQGRLGEAYDVLAESPVPVEAIDAFPLCHVRLARARVRLAAGDFGGAAEDALAAGAIYDDWGVTNPALAPWRSVAALALHARGEAGRAEALAREELERAERFGAPRARAAALRAVALMGPPEDGADLLARAIATLSGSGAILERARALVELGALQRRRGRRADAEPALREGLDLAHRCRAGALAARARDELVAAGARPRRASLHGAEALTAQELRIARMAAEGLTNREIAQTLFVTLSTVEAHLTRAYRKLDVGSRRDLGAALVREGE